MISCYLVDDEFRALHILSKFVDQTPGLVLAGSSEDPVEALQRIIADPPDIVFLDINMPQLSGLDLSEMVKSKSAIVFTTAYPEHAIRAFEIDAADYLLKPIAYERFLKSVAKVSQTLHHSGNAKEGSDYYYIKSDVKGKLVRILLNEITYIEAAQNYLIIHLGTARQITYLTMKELESELDPARFARIHKSYMVNLAKIKSVESGAVILEDKTGVLIGATYREQFLRQLSSKMLISKRS